MGNWKLIVPAARTNYVLNPSAETTGNYTNNATGTVARSTTYALFGVYCYKIDTTAAAANGGTFSMAEFPNTSGVISFWVYGTLAATTRVYIGLNNVAPVLSETWGSWRRYYAAFTQVIISGAKSFNFLDTVAATYYVDGIVAETGQTPTTYIDGDETGCAWRGVPHASVSTRSAASRAGGVVYDLETQYYFYVETETGTGDTPLAVTVDGYAVLPGGALNQIKRQPGVFTLAGNIHGAANLHTARQNLLAALAHDSYPRGGAGWQPVTLRYTGASVYKAITAHYSGGLAGNIDNSAAFGTFERLALRFETPDPLWSALSDSAVVLDVEDSLTLRYMAGRLSGRWDDLGLAAAGTPSVVYALRVGPDGKIYVGGAFSGWDGVAGRDKIAVYDPIAGSWANVGNASDLNGDVCALVFGPDGALYAGGAFTNAGGDANADYIAKWNGSAWSAVSGGGTGRVWDIAVGSSGELYIAGDFTNWNGIANADYIVKWDGSSYTALGTGADGIVFSVERSPVSDTIFAGGAFDNIGGVASEGIAEWNGSAWVALNAGGLSGASESIGRLAIDSTGLVYAGGSFTSINSVNANYIARWNGAVWEALGAGVSGDVYALHVAPNDDVYVGMVDSAGFVRRWAGNAWTAIDANLPGAAGTKPVRAIVTANADPVLSNVFDVYLGFSESGAVTVAGDTTVNYDQLGTATAYPRIVITRAGGTSASLVSLRNETSGAELWFYGSSASEFAYPLLDGERLEIELSPGRRSVTSSFRGDVTYALRPNSAVAEFCLWPGSNLLTAFVNNDGATITAYMVWRNRYIGYD